MITGFEDYTAKLTAEEKELLPVLKRWFSKMRKKVPIKSFIIVKWVNGLKGKHKPHIPFTGSRLRKFVNYMRGNSILPIIATSKGYYVSYKKEDITKEVISLKDRVSGIRFAARGLEKMVGKKPIRRKYVRRKKTVLAKKKATKSRKK